MVNYICRILLSKVIDSGYDDTQWPLTNSRNGKSSGMLKLILHYAGAKTVSSCSPVSETRGFKQRCVSSLILWKLVGKVSLQIESLQLRSPVNIV